MPHKTKESRAAYHREYRRKRANCPEFRAKRKEYRTRWLASGGREHLASYSSYRRARRRAHIAKIKVKTGCQNCGYDKHSAALDFHHINPTEKDVNVGNLLDKSLKRLFNEIRKCTVLCANCHRIETYDNNLQN